MKYYLGVDGGGTKTAFMLISEDGKKIVLNEQPTCHYNAVGVEGFEKVARDGFDAVVKEAAIAKSDVAGVAFGIPGYGEEPEWDEKLTAKVHEVFAGIPTNCVNDAEVGWAGSLAMEPGVNAVAGTGAIMFGRTTDGRTARTSGWCEVFGDEGSCYWLGRLCAELFSKEADGRLPKGKLYDLVMQKLGFKDPFEMITLAYGKLHNSRRDMAQLQIILCDAAEAGDPVAISAYERAADELALGINALIRMLEFKAPVKVSYSGGAYRSGDLLLKPLAEKIAPYGGTLVEPRLSPVAGSALLGAQAGGVSDYSALIAGIEAFEK